MRGAGPASRERGEGPEFGLASWLGEVWIGVGSVVLSQQMAGLVLLGSPDGFSTGAHSNTPEHPQFNGERRPFILGSVHNFECK